MTTNTSQSLGNRLGALVLVAGVLACGGDAASIGDPVDESTAADALPCIAPASYSQAAPIVVSLPPDVANLPFSSYSIPITVGIPIPRGAMLKGRFVTVAQDSSTSPGQKCRRSFQTRVPSIWDPAPASGPPEVKWLLVDAIVQVDGGSVKPIELGWDNARAPDAPETFDWGSGFASSLAVNGGAPESALPVDKVGSFQLWPSNETIPSIATPEVDPNSNKVTTKEVDGGVRVVLTSRGTFVRGTRRIGSFTNRYTLYRGQPYVRVHHTMVWGRDEIGTWPSAQAPPDEEGFDYRASSIDRLSYFAPVVSSSHCGKFTVGLGSGATDVVGCVPTRFKQGRDGVDRFDPTSSTRLPESLAGWAHVDNSDLFANDLFIGLRWAREQFPTAFAIGTPASATTEVRLLDSQGMSWNDLSSNDDTAGRDDSGEDATGVAKTYELLIWPEALGTTRNPVLQNAIAQGTIVAYAAPVFATRADVPTPMSPCIDCKTGSTDTAVVENAIADAFSFMTREHSPGSASEHQRLGAFHFGDALYQWNAIDMKSTGSGRYWLNSGNGSTALPWLLWMRSGDSSYRQFAEANARHLVDVDMVNVSRHLPLGCGRKGMLGSYGLTHGAFVKPPWNQCEYALSKSEESDGIVLAYHLTGDLRLRDALEYRASHLDQQATQPTSPLELALGGLQGTPYCLTSSGFAVCAPNDTTRYMRSRAFGALPLGSTLPGGEDPHAEYRILAELCTMHEAFSADGKYPHLRGEVQKFLDAILALQDIDKGVFETLTRVSYLEVGLQCARRVLPDRRRAIDEALARWHETLGTMEIPALPRAVASTPPRWEAGKTFGLLSPTAALARFDARGDRRALADAQGQVLTQALAFQSAASVTGAGAGWRGMGELSTYLSAAVIRDWLAVLARSRPGTPYEPFRPTLLASTYVYRPLWLYNAVTGDPNLPVADRDRVANRLYALKDRGDELYLSADFNFDNGGYPRRLVRYESYFGDTTTAIQSGVACIGPRALDWYRAQFGYVDSSGGSECASSMDPSGTLQGEGTLLSLPSSELQRAGVYRFDVSIPSTQMVIGSYDAILVRPVANRALSFSGASTLSFTNSPRLWGHDHMTLAARVRVVGASAGQTPVKMDQVYALSVTPASTAATVTASFTLEKGAIVTTVSHSISAAGMATQPTPVVATLDIDAPTGDVRVTLCSTLCSTRLVNLPGYHIRDASVLQPNPALVLGQGFSGTLDELRIIDRVVSSTERSWIVSVADAQQGPALYTAHPRDLGGGEVFLFDGSLDATSGTAYLVAGTPVYATTTPTFSRPARQGKLVQYDRTQELPGVHRPYDASWAAVGGTGFQSERASGLLWSTRQASTTLSACFPSFYSKSRFGFVGLLGGTTVTSPILDSALSPTPACVLPQGAADVGAGTTVRMLVNGNGTGAPISFTGLKPYFARSAETLFDPMSCESNANAHVATFSGTSALTLPNFSRGSAYTLSFKMNVAGTATATVLNKANELTVAVSGGTLSVSAGYSGGSVSLSATYPANQWGTVTTTVVATLFAVEARLYFNGIEVARKTVATTNGLGASTSPLIVGNSAPGGPSASFPGKLDDIWVEAGTQSPAIQTWYVCESSHPGALVFQSFEGSPVLPAGVSIVPR